MEEVKLPITGITRRDGVSLENETEILRDAFLDSNGYIRSRGGLKQITTTGDALPNAKIDGLYYWSTKNLVLIVAGRHLYTLDSSNVVTDIGSGLESGQRASFAIVRTSGGEESAVVTNGGDMYLYKPDSATFTNLYTTDNDAPRNVIQVEFLDQYLIALSADSRFFHYSKVADPEDWEALDFGVAEAKADNINQIYVKGSYLYLFGEQSVEIYYDDGTTPFSRVSGGIIENGLIAKDTVAKVDDQLFWLDSNRRIVTLNGSSYQVVSDNIDKLLEQLDEVDDAYAYPLYHQGKSFYVIHFPSASRSVYDGSVTSGLTLVYDLSNQQFTEFANWDTLTSSYKKFPIFSQTYAVSRRQQILGSEIANGKLFELDVNTYQDDSSYLRPEWISGYYDLGTLNRKRLNKLRMRMQAGTSTISTVVIFNYRKDGQSDFESTREQLLTTGSSSLNQHHLLINNLGIFRSIQFKISSATASPLILGDIKSFIDVLTQ